MQSRLRTRLDDQLCIEVEVEIQPAIGFAFVDLAGHEPEGGVVVALGFNEAAIEPGELGIALHQRVAEQLTSRSSGLR